jgi:hypothetical protein
MSDLCQKCEGLPIATDVCSDFCRACHNQRPKSIEFATPHITHVYQDRDRVKSLEDALSEAIDENQRLRSKIADMTSEFQWQIDEINGMYNLHVGKLKDELKKNADSIASAKTDGVSTQQNADLLKQVESLAVQIDHVDKVMKKKATEKPKVPIWNKPTHAQPIKKAAIHTNQPDF